VATMSGQVTTLWLWKVDSLLYCGNEEWSGDYTVATESGQVTILWLRRVVR